MDAACFLRMEINDYPVLTPRPAFVTVCGERKGKPNMKKSGDLAIEVLLERCREKERELAELYEAIENLRQLQRPAVENRPVPESEDQPAPVAAKPEDAIPKDERFGSLFKDLSIPKAVIEVLKNSEEPLTSARVTEIVNANRTREASYSSVAVALGRMESTGGVKRLPDTKPAQWVIGGGEG